MQLQCSSAPDVSSYSLLFASRGANVVVNDFNAAAAQKVVDEITQGVFGSPKVVLNGRTGLLGSLFSWRKGRCEHIVGDRR